jgi:hypothetical protein
MEVKRKRKKIHKYFMKGALVLLVVAILIPTMLISSPNLLNSRVEAETYSGPYYFAPFPQDQNKVKEPDWVMHANTTDSGNIRVEFQRTLKEGEISRATIIVNIDGIVGVYSASAPQEQHDSAQITKYQNQNEYYSIGIDENRIFYVELAVLGDVTIDAQLCAVDGECREFLFAHRLDEIKRGDSISFSSSKEFNVLGIGMNENGDLKVFDDSGVKRARFYIDSSFHVGVYSN